MPLLDHLPTDGMMIGLSVNSKKQLLEHISAHAGSLTKVPAQAVFDALIKRERLGSTLVAAGHTARGICRADAKCGGFNNA